MSFRSLLLLMLLSLVLPACDDGGGTSQTDAADTLANDATSSETPEETGADTADVVASVTPIYVSFYSHNEAADNWEAYVTDRTSYEVYRADLIERVDLIQEYGATLNWESDHSVLRAMAAHENGALLDATNGKNILRWMVEDKRIVVDPHGHLDQYNMADLAHLIEQLGVTPSKVIGGVAVLSCGATASELQWLDWRTTLEIDASGVIHGKQFPDATWQPEIMAQAAMVGHTGDDFTSGVWRPGNNAAFMTPQTTGIVYVGEGYPHDTNNLGATNSGGAPIFYTDAGYVRELAAMIAAGEVPADGFYTASIHIRDLPKGEVPSVLEGQRKTLQALEPLVASGQVVYLDYEKVAALWESEFGGVPSQLLLERFTIADDVATSIEQSCSAAPDCQTAGCPTNQVCVPMMGVCAPDCRVVSGVCPPPGAPSLTNCDSATGLCTP